MAKKAFDVVMISLFCVLGAIAPELGWWLTLCGAAAIFAFSVVGYSVISAVTELMG